MAQEFGKQRIISNVNEPKVLEEDCGQSVPSRSADVLQEHQADDRFSSPSRPSSAIATACFSLAHTSDKS
jgi:hypothetical protein